MWAVEELPLNCLERIFGQIPDIRTRLYLELVSQRFGQFARRFCWKNDRVLEITPHVTSFLELRSVNIKLFSEILNNDWGVSCKVENLPEAVYSLLYRVGIRLRDLRLWGSTYSCPLTAQTRWLHQTLMELAESTVPKLGRILVTNEFAHSLLVPSLVDRNVQCLRAVHFSIASEFYDEHSQCRDTVLGICGAVANCMELEDLTLELCDTELISDQILARILTGKRHLKFLRLRKIVNISGDGVAAAIRAAGFEALEELEISQCKIFQLRGFLDALSAPLAELIVFRYWPTEEDENFGNALSAIPPTFPSLSKLDITEWSFSFHNPESLADLIAQFLRLQKNAAEARVLEIEAHCVLLMTISQLISAVLERMDCTLVEQNSRVANKFGQSEYTARFARGNATVCFTFSVQ